MKIRWCENLMNFNVRAHNEHTIRSNVCMCASCVFTYNLCWLNFALHWTNIDKLQLMDTHIASIHCCICEHSIYSRGTGILVARDASCLSALRWHEIPKLNKRRTLLSAVLSPLSQAFSEHVCGVNICVCVFVPIDDRCAVWLSDGASLIQYICETSSHVPIVLKLNKKTHSFLMNEWWHLLLVPMTMKKMVCRKNASERASRRRKKKNEI